uniref:DEAD/DEAH box helicase domain-containing protein n=1 Tax=uncultured organism TaxID=155900 RepID=M1QBM0_9ZZZZ|nr:DEAD/DEAH box helicase domain-containing protein [uncultured organism]
MNLNQICSYLKDNEKYNNRITHWKEIPEKKAEYAEFPEGIKSKIIKVLQEKGINKLYTHQAQAYKTARSGENLIVVTPTASGKTLCYNLPVLDQILQDDSSRALYLFPTKALSQDQLAELYDLIERLEEDIKTYTYDGDTQVNARKNIRNSGHIVITNPDMLHTGILPHHTKWVKLFENLEYIIIDEIHNYRGVFGSHVANVIKRLQRICNFYGSDPQFIAASATIANPQQHAQKLINQEVKLIDENGAPRGPKDIVFYNPPVVNQQLGIRRSYILEARKLARLLLKNQIKSIVFTRSRLRTEILLSYLKEEFRNKKQEIRGYRGGYLPGERRKIEKGLRAGEITGVVSTNALELGIDIGRLDACIIAGYPGSIASTWQQAGRAGRRNTRSLALMIATSSPLDQYIVNHPDYFFQQPVESALINPDNLLILMSHIKCAAFELPFTEEEDFGVDTINEILSYLEEQRILRHTNGKWHWMAPRYPAEDISLRSASSDDFAVIDTTSKPEQVIAKVDHFSALTTIHKDAIYIHESNQYQVKELDYEGKKAYVEKVNVNYYTDANLAVDLRILEKFENKKNAEVEVEHGEVVVSAKATMFKKVKFNTHENVGYGDINLPEMEMHTCSYWVCYPLNFENKYGKKELESGLLGTSNLLKNIAPVYLMCDPGDINSTIHVRSPYTDKPTIYLYESYPGGLGMSEKLYNIHEKLYKKALEHLRSCSCESGCPACVGPVNEVGPDAKEYAFKLIRKGIENEY